ILSNFIKTFNQCNNKFDNGFFLIGRRTDLNIENLIDFSEDKIEESLILESSKSGKLSEVTSIDYFLFPHNNFKTIPPLRIGRAGYDNLLIYWAKKYEKIPIIDGTENILAIHQKHDYKHVSGGKNEVYEGKEAMENIKMSGGADKLFFITESDYKVKDQKIIKNNGWRYYLSKRYLFNVLPALHPFFYPLVLFKNSIKYIKK
ncbi:MAG: hypothetical protein NTU76_01560, partial [Candidatus Taylorbacteria bacterium]|nr:hypothetical protein [Candidatus Taylorbacteria bacterium]